MSNQGRAIRFHETGNPVTTPVIDELSTPDPAAGEVTVRIEQVPIHPADLNTITGTYGKKPELPAVPGSEAFGRIEAVGADVPDSMAVGTPVILRHRTGTWRDFMTLEADGVTPVPEALDPQQAAMLKINPVTAWRLLHEPMSLNAGDWVVQNAANSAVGICLIQVAAHLGIHTLNVVRSEGAAEPCRSVGAEHVFLDDDSMVAEALKVTDGARPRLACNAVSGPAAIKLMDLLGPSGRMVTYGAMSRQAMKIPNSFLIFKDLSFTGLWVTRWLESASTEEWNEVISTLADLMVSGALKIPVAASYPAEDFRDALEHANKDQRNGKIMLDFTK